MKPRTCPHCGFMYPIGFSLIKIHTKPIWAKRQCINCGKGIKLNIFFLIVYVVLFIALMQLVFVDVYSPAIRFAGFFVYALIFMIVELFVLPFQKD
jgi:hypothetical protein